MNDPQAMRINADLAKEIGLNESIVLLQFEFLIAQSGIEKDGMLWTYWTLAKLKEYYFKWWSVATISRTITSLEEMGLIYVRNDLNLKGYDRTQWFALNFDGIVKLTSIAVSSSTPQSDAILQNAKSILQSADMQVDKLQNGKNATAAVANAPKDASAILQDATTIHENKENNKESVARHARTPRSPSGKEPRQTDLDGFHEGCRIVKQAISKKLVPASARRIAREVTDLAHWQTVVDLWAQRYGTMNVDGMLDWYHHPHKMQRKDAAAQQDRRPQPADAPQVERPPMVTPEQVAAARVRLNGGR